MKFLSIYHPAKQAPPTPEQLQGIMAFSEEMTKSGVLVMTGGMVRQSSGPRAKLAKGEFTVTDGPFAETKELIDGFALIEVKSQEEAYKVARRFLSIAGEGECELLRIYGPGEEGPGH